MRTVPFSYLVSRPVRADAHTHIQLYPSIWTRLGNDVKHRSSQRKAGTSAHAHTCSQSSTLQDHSHRRSYPSPSLNPTSQHSVRTRPCFGQLCAQVQSLVTIHKLVGTRMVHARARRRHDLAVHGPVALCGRCAHRLGEHPKVAAPLWCALGRGALAHATVLIRRGRRLVQAEVRLHDLSSCVFVCE